MCTHGSGYGRVLLGREYRSTLRNRWTLIIRSDKIVGSGLIILSFAIFFFVPELIGRSSSTPPECRS